MKTPETEIDARLSDPAAIATGWDMTLALFGAAELYFLRKAF